MPLVIIKSCWMPVNIPVEVLSTMSEVLAVYGFAATCSVAQGRGAVSIRAKHRHRLTALPATYLDEDKFNRFSVPSFVLHPEHGRATLLVMLVCLLRLL